MSFQFECKTKHRAALPSPAAAGAGRQDQIRRRFFPLTVIGVVVCLCCSSIPAEEQIPNELDAGQLLSSSRFTYYARPAEALHNVAPESADSQVPQLFGYTDEFRPDRFSRRDAAQMELKRDSTVMLLFKRMPSRNSYQVWAALGTGFGRIFPDDIFGRSRTNGAGVLESEWLYLKMSFRF